MTTRFSKIVSLASAPRPTCDASIPIAPEVLASVRMVLVGPLPKLEPVKSDPVRFDRLRSALVKLEPRALPSMKVIP